MTDLSSLPGAEAMEGLRGLLRACSPLALAFSGGLDSRFLAHAAHLWASDGIRAHLLHITGPHVPEAETRAALLWAEARGLPLTLVPVNPLELPEVRATAEDRCYHCKHRLFSALREMVRHPAFCSPPCAGATLCDGTNADDLAAYRPGLRALRELGVRSPLAEAGLGKALLRSLGAGTGLDNPDQTARPCLLTRFAYGTPVSAVVLPALSGAEEAVEGLLKAWAAENGGRTLPEFRLRLVGLAPGGGLAQPSGREYPPGAYQSELHLSAAPDETWQKKLAQAVQAAGFAYPQMRFTDSVRGYYDQGRNL